MEEKIESGPWEWFVEKVLPTLFLSVALAVGGGSFAVWQSVNRLTDKVAEHDAKIAKLEAEQKTLVTGDKLLDVLKRVEQQLQITMLQAGIKTKIEIK